MSEAIQFLETLGSSPATSRLNTGGYAEALAGLDIDADLRQALMGRDANALSKLLDGRPRMFCLVVAPDGGETEDAPDKSDDDDEPGKTDDAPERTDRPD